MNYKILAEVLANRLKKLLPRIISHEQSAFVSGRSITDNVLVAFEIIHHMKRKNKGKQGDVAFKIDISKAYDKIDWGFLKGIMLKLGFDNRWVDLMMMCVSTVRYNVLVNGMEVGPIILKRGLRQGDPLSPYLFILCAEGLSSLIKRVEFEGLLHGCRVSKTGLTVSHLLFADYSLFFFRASESECNVMNKLLIQYKEASGQGVNFTKFGIMFNSNVKSTFATHLSSIVDVSKPLNTGRYLGLPSLIGKKKKMVFTHIKEHVWQRTQGWRNRPLSRAGREVLIKSAAQSIPTYYMSTFMLPTSILDEIQKMLNSFWWGSQKYGNGGIKWLAWDKLSVKNAKGGLGFRNLHCFNIAMLGKIC